MVALLGLWASACSEPNHAAVIAEELGAALVAGESADVIVNLRDHDATARVIASLGDTLHVSHRYRSLGAFAGRITPGALERLRDDPDVSFVHRSAAASGLLLESVPLAGVDRARVVYGLTGRGVRVGVFDSGIDREHTDLQGAVVVERCFARNACAPWNADQGTDAMDAHGHGTSVAGAIASRGVEGPPGFAPEAELVAVKVNGPDNRGQEADYVTALEWIHDNQAELQLSVLNMSVGTDVLYDDAAACERAHPAMAMAVHDLIDVGISVVVAGGNLGSTSQLPAPACFAGVIAVGATYDADVGAAPPSGGNFQLAQGLSFAACRDATTRAGQIACYNNAAEGLSVVAPGGPMLTLRREGGTLTTWGTSVAAGAVSGVAALLRQCNPALPPGELAEALRSTGEMKEDPRSKRSFPFVRALEAARAVCPVIMPDAGGTGGSPPTSEPAPDAGTTPPPAAEGGEPSGGVAAAGSVAEAPRRDGSELQGPYKGPAPAKPLASRPREREDAGARSGSDGGMGGHASPRTEAVSSCGVTRPRGAHAPFWSLVLALLALRVRYSPRCRCPRRRCGCPAARRRPRR
ncbi:MAG TPA: S8 family serine peptidase [Polyangiales bacterium]|nr:S8 family serine peptidase [Polyangiales bacterium]